ncbi:MAG: threonine ammonia-lyase [Candidatus Schekmanbacteria bacterium RIFCSPHIGHO2_02_FULL_38_11]|uniref:threonine ammonia-lyase n=1 Tax=Candidatus Schekmanbacteria bacterium RIFCSPLOWO2_12_FULL_38_15 TaxID=1817883 RepID=A0A1F7SFA2_9BACT|nr:MAG: threonine ammonia-lyase [Candidatus Schekmanbacteria bacterium GWA2_38_9]OGL50596.1 MAG: threonine ammonia-lyase [Candidatus Schekmanbacteria bacterium RIFCSPLOWO2_02_FULL_38_14]OGL52460.1 MAG: threonine ammonia-lyase [Candidatus Schekmanbacteria bacterium RIFCSPLOWO2_12_FULL_38_15]OGL52908.1 MAG: threonine ammonia-lyase [Candidatus Schekmanbacteria bacterium RIFCSPHIGHO2_02_FULL_38_11]
MISVKDIEQAKKRLKGIINEKNFIKSEILSDYFKTNIYLKLENLQKTGSFKIRGSFNFISQLTKEEKVRGVVTASAGNHAQSVAYACLSFGIKATVVMPKGTPLTKVRACKSFGAEIIFNGSTYDDAYEKAMEICKEKNRVFIHAFDDYDVIAGQGTIGIEILEQAEDIDMVIVPIGGGGLISGISVAIKEKNPSVKIIGVEAEEAASAFFSRKMGKVVHLPMVKTIADGIAVKSVGTKTFPIIEKYVDEIVTVNEEEISEAILMFMEQGKLTVEGAGAAPLAALLGGKVKFEGKRVVLVISGGNIDVNMVSRIIEKGLLRAGRFTRIIIDINDIPGALAKIAEMFGIAEANILHIVHERAALNIPFGKTRVKLDLETKGFDHIKEIINILESKGFNVSIEK